MSPREWLVGYRDGRFLVLKRERGAKLWEETPVRCHTRYDAEEWILWKRSYDLRNPKRL